MGNGLFGIRGHNREINYLFQLKDSGAMPHALIFTGEAGIGKRMVADVFAASILCKENNPPCFDCKICSQLKAKTYPDLIILERDDKGKIPLGSEKTENGTVRWMIDTLSRSPMQGKYVAVVDGVDSISEAGQNALLKTIEEPGINTIIILIADNKSTILPTILSRCIEIAFHPLSETDVASILKEKFPHRNDINLISSISGGSAGFAIKLCQDNNLEKILSIASNISNYIKKGKINSDDIPIGGGIEASYNLTILINIYTLMIREAIKGKTYSFNEEIVLDIESAQKIVKILLATKAGLRYNLNTKNFIRGIFNSMDNLNKFGFIEPDFSWI